MVWWEAWLKLFDRPDFSPFTLTFAEMAQAADAEREVDLTEEMGRRSFWEPEMSGRREPTAGMSRDLTSLRLLSPSSMWACSVHRHNSPMLSRHDGGHR